MPVSTRIRNAPRLSVPRNQVTWKARDRLRILTEDRCRKTFCWMARARCRFMAPKPLRNTDRHTRVSRKLARCVSREFAMSGSHKLLLGERFGTVYQQISFVADPRFEPNQGTGRGAFDLAAVAIKLAAVAGARDDSQLRFPGGQAAQVGAHRRHRVEALGAMHDLDAGLQVLRH